VHTHHLNACLYSSHILPARAMPAVTATPVHAARSPPVEVQIPAPQKQENQIAPNECDQNTQISPSVIESDAQSLVELIADFIRAVFASGRGVIDDVTKTARREI
jgi:hypothetical protein